MTPHPPFEIFINRRRLEAPRSPMTGLEILELGDYGPDYNLFLLQGEGDSTGGEPIEHDQSMELRNGLHFRAIPGNANFGDR